jgi:hypothetical protein
LSQASRQKANDPLKEMLDYFDDNSDVCISAVFPELNNWEVKSYAITAEPDTDGDGLQISLNVCGTDFDYPDPMALIEEAAEAILARKNA